MASRSNKNISKQTKACKDNQIANKKRLSNYMRSHTETRSKNKQGERKRKRGARINADQREATRSNAKQREATRGNAKQRDATRSNAKQREATRRNATQRNATERNATQRSATQRSAPGAWKLEVARENQPAQRCQPALLENLIWKDDLGDRENLA